MNESLIYEVESIARSQGYRKLQKGTQQGNVYRDKRHRITQDTLDTLDQNTGICTGSGRDKIHENTIL